MNKSIPKKIFIGITLVILCVVVTSCKGTSTEVKSEEETTVIVQLKEEGTESALENEFATYGLEKKKVLSRPLFIFLFTFDTQKTTNTELVELLKKSPLVKEAQLNRNVELRN